MASVNGSPSPPGTLRWMEYPSPPRAQDKQCRSTKKQESSRMSAQNVAVYRIDRVFINDIMGPQGGPLLWVSKWKGLLYRNLNRELNMVPRALALGHSPLRQAPRCAPWIAETRLIIFFYYKNQYTVMSQWRMINIL